ncbi:MAG: hypothetical protein EON95_13550, partial [Caulobacteraceae bacterium]
MAAVIQFGTGWGATIEDETGVANISTLFISGSMPGETFEVFVVFGNWVETLDIVHGDAYNQYNDFGYEIGIFYTPAYNDDYFLNIDGNLRLYSTWWPFYDEYVFFGPFYITRNTNFALDDVGSSVGDLLYGDADDNDLIGLGGDDIMAGSLGADQMNGGDGSDTVDYRLSDAGINLTLGGPALGGHAQGDTLVSVENIYGSDFNDTLTGDAGANLLRGYGGDDVMTLGGGADTVVVLDTDGGADVVVDFDVAVDKVVLSSLAEWLSRIADGADTLFT